MFPIYIYIYIYISPTVATPTARSCQSSSMGIAQGQTWGMGVGCLKGVKTCWHWCCSTLRKACHRCSCSDSAAWTLSTFILRQLRLSLTYLSHKNARLLELCSPGPKSSPTTISRWGKVFLSFTVILVVVAFVPHILSANKL